jgi:hypothetical protein
MGINVVHSVRGKSSNVSLHDIIYYYPICNFVHFDEIPIPEMEKIINEISLGKRTIKISYHKKGPYSKGGPPYYDPTDNLRHIIINELNDFSSSDSIDFSSDNSIDNESNDIIDINEFYNSLISIMKTHFLWQ